MACESQCPNQATSLLNQQDAQNICSNAVAEVDIDGLEIDVFAQMSMENSKKGYAIQIHSLFAIICLLCK